MKPFSYSWMRRIALALGLMLAMAQAVFAFEGCRAATVGLAGIEAAADSCAQQNLHTPAGCAIHCDTLGVSTVTTAAPAIHAPDVRGAPPARIALFALPPRESSRAGPVGLPAPPARLLRLNLRI